LDGAKPDIDNAIKESFKDFSKIYQDIQEHSEHMADPFKDAINKFLPLLLKALEEKAELKAKIEQAKADLRTNLEREKTDLEKRTTELIEQKRKEIEKVEKHWEDTLAEKQRELTEEKQKAIENVQQKLENALAKKQSELEEIASDYKKCLNNLKARQYHLQNEKEIQQNVILNIQSQQSDSREHASLGQRMDGLELQKYEDLQKQLQNLQQEKDHELTVSNKKLQESNSLLESTQSQLKKRSKEFDDLKSQLEDMNSKLLTTQSTLREKTHDLMDSIVSVQNVQEELQLKKAENKELSVQLQDAMKKKIAHADEVDELMGQLSECEKEIDAFKMKLTIFNKGKEIRERELEDLHENLRLKQEENKNILIQLDCEVAEKNAHTKKVETLTTQLSERGVGGATIKCGVEGATIKCGKLIAVGPKRGAFSPFWT